MPRTAALRRIDSLGFDVRPEINELAVIRNAMDDYFAAEHHRGVEAATAASTHAAQKHKKDEETSSKYRREAHRRKLHKVSILGADSVELNFEFARNKNSITDFMIRLRRVYRD
jgi:hypothetical protein